jgi:2-isopropylmalate synthase
LAEWTSVTTVCKTEPAHAIKKGLAEREQATNRQPSTINYWDVPYLTIDPADIGREYHEVIRVNSQSGKGGVAYLLESEFGILLPKDMQREFGPIANDAVDKLGREVSGAELKAMFWKEYIERIVPWQLEAFETVSRSVAQSEKVLRSAGGKWEASQATKSQQIVQCRARLLRDGKPMEISGQGNGPLAALVHGFITAGVPRFEIMNYSEHALGSGEEASAISYIQIKLADGKTRWGAGVDTNIELASIRAVLSALNRS